MTNRDKRLLELLHAIHSSKKYSKADGPLSALSRNGLARVERDPVTKRAIGATLTESGEVVLATLRAKNGV